MVDVNRLFVEVTTGDLADLLRAGEGPQIEFKARLASVLELARNVSALANTQGGVIVVGARETVPQIVHGGDDSRLNHFIDDLHKRLRPVPPLQMHRVNYGGANVSVIVVKPHPSEVVVSDEGAFMRIGDRNTLMTASQIQAKLPPVPSPVTNQHFAEGIASLSKELAEVKAEFRYAQSIRGQLHTYLIGFVLGILASLVASFIYVVIIS